MQRSWIYLLTVLLLLVSCAPLQSPSEIVASTVADVQSACNDACSGQHAVVSVDLPPNATLSSQPYALCVLDGNRLFCAACSCGVAGMTNLTGPGNFSCSFDQASSGVNVSCGTLPPADGGSAS